MDTCEAIRTTFMGLYAHERLNRITVKGLYASVSVARTTFYAHYRNVDDVLVDVEDGLLSGLAEVTQSGDTPGNEGTRPSLPGVSPGCRLLRDVSLGL